LITLRGSNLHLPEAKKAEGLLDYFLILNKMGFRPFHDAKGPVMP
jgi:hypothetical protein